MRSAPLGSSTFIRLTLLVPNVALRRVTVKRRYTAPPARASRPARRFSTHGVHVACCFPQAGAWNAADVHA